MTRARQAPETNNLVLVIEADIGEQTLNYTWFFEHVASFSDLEAGALVNSQPGTVICPLIFGRFDAIDVGELLQQIPIRPRLLVKPLHLPRPAMVLGELRKACPFLQIEFLTDQLNVH